MSKNSHKSLSSALPGEVEAQRYCRGCGEPLPAGLRVLFHPNCRKADKRGRVRRKREAERKRFAEWLSRCSCPQCGTRLGQSVKSIPGLSQELPQKGR